MYKYHGSFAGIHHVNVLHPPYQMPRDILGFGCMLNTLQFPSKAVLVVDPRQAKMYSKNSASSVSHLALVCAFGSLGIVISNSFV